MVEIIIGYVLIAGTYPAGVKWVSVKKISIGDNYENYRELFIQENQTISSFIKIQPPQNPTDSMAVSINEMASSQALFRLRLYRTVPQELELQLKYCSDKYINLFVQENQVSPYLSKLREELLCIA